MPKKYKKPNIDEVVECTIEACKYYFFNVLWYQYCGNNYCTDCMECHKEEIQVSQSEYIEQLDDNVCPMDHIHLRLKRPVDGKCGDTLAGTMQEEFESEVFERFQDENMELFTRNDNHNYRVIDKLMDSKEYQELKARFQEVKDYYTKERILQILQEGPPKEKHMLDEAINGTKTFTPSDDIKFDIISAEIAGKRVSSLSEVDCRITVSLTPPLDKNAPTRLTFDNLDDLLACLFANGILYGQEIGYEEGYDDGYNVMWWERHRYFMNQRKQQENGK